ncbi:MAG: helix-turn-helix domain-containing protein [Propionibacteriaceae bacterium]|jgi:DNA-binding PucR family transcriptional regulator|nr:helix-turn-helix domain-containing protein [Propionibacteriaceae bacterium]
MGVDIGSIQQMLNQSDPLELITGEPQSRVTGVAGIRAGDDVALLCQAGDLVVVLDTPPAPGWPMDAFLRRCGDIGAVAVAFARCPFDLGSKAVAARLGLAVLLCGKPWQLSIAVYESLHSPVNDKIGALARALVEVLQTAGTDLEELLKQASAVARHDFMLLDTQGNGLFSQTNWSAADQAVLALRLAKSTISFNAVLPSGIRLIARRVGLTGRDVWLGVSLPGDDSAEAEVLSNGLAIVQAAAAQRLASLQMLHERDSRTRTALLSEIMESGSELSEGLRHRTLAAGWDLRGWHVGIRIIALGEGTTISLRDELLMAFAAQNLKLRAVEQTDGWMAWLSFASEPTRSTELISAAIRRAQRSFNNVLRTAMGVGSLLAGATGLVKSLGQATDAARIAANRPTSGYFVHIDRLGLAQLLLALTHTDVFTPAAKGLLDPLGDPDGALIATLTAFLDNRGSQSETAAILGIHRNTVAQRLNRIKELLAVDLDDPETRLALHLACRAVKVIP